MATGIDGKSKQNPRFLYSPLLLKNELSVRSRTVGPQTPDTAQSHSSRVSPASGCSASQAGISREIPTLRGRKPPPSARRCGKIALTFSMHWSVNSRVQCSLRGLRGGLPFLFFPTAAGAGRILDGGWQLRISSSRWCRHFRYRRNDSLCFIDDRWW